MKKITDYQEEFHKLVREISFGERVKIKFLGTRMCADVKRREIFLPNFPIKGNLRDVMVGAIYHEAGHINYTRKWNPQTSWDAHCLNAFEDIRIETKMEKNFFCRDSYNVLYQWAMDIRKNKNLDNYYQTPEALLQEIIVQARKYETKLVRDDLNPFLARKLKEYSEFIVVPNKWEEVEILAKRFQEKVKNDPDYQKKQEETQSENNYFQDLLDSIEENEQKQRKASDQGTNNKKDEIEKNKEEIKQSKEKINDIKKDDSITKKEKKQKLEELRDKNKELRDRNKQLKKEIEEKTSEFKELKKEERELKGRLNDHLKKLKIESNHHDLEEMINDAIGEYMNDPSNFEEEFIDKDGNKQKFEPHIPQSKKNDKIEVIGKGGQYKPSDPIYDQIARKLHYELSRVLKARKQIVDERGLKRGTVDRNRLWKKNDPRIFKQKEERIIKEVAVTLLFDISSSMLGRRFKEARDSIYVVAKALQGLNVSFEIVGFSTKNMVTKQEQASFPFNRSFTEHLHHVVIKSFTANDIGGLGKLEVLDNTPSCESILWAGNRLLARPEPRKVLFFFTDGMPSFNTQRSQIITDKNTEVNIAELEKMGAEVIGIGIETDIMKYTFKHFIEVQSAKNLSEVTAKMIYNVLKGKNYSFEKREEEEEYADV